MPVCRGMVVYRTLPRTPVVMACRRHRYMAVVQYYYSEFLQK